MAASLPSATDAYQLTLPCGCAVMVVCEPKTRVTRARVIERRGERCGAPTHEPGARVYLWELLPARLPLA